MRYLVLIILLCCPVFGQTTAVTFTITDSDSQVWSNGTFIVTFVPVPGNPGPYVYNGSPMTAAQKGPYLGSMNGSGTGTVNLPSNNFIVPTGTKWQFVLAPNASAPSSTVVSAVTGASQNLSSTFSSAVTAPRFPALGTSSWGYLDGEVTPTPNPGGSYFNVTLKAVRVWDGTAWFSLSNTTGTVTSVGMQGDNVVYNTAVTGSPITTSGTLIPTLKVQNLHTVFGNPTGGAATPIFTADPIVTSLTATTVNTTDINITGTCTGCSGTSFPLLAPDGSAAAPSYSFTNNSNAGMYRSGVNQIAFSTFGIQRVTIDSSGLFASTSLNTNGAVTGGSGSFTDAVGIGSIFSLSALSKTATLNDAVIDQTSSGGTPAYLASGPEVSAPSSPGATFQRAYFKAGSGICAKDSSGVERCTQASSNATLTARTTSACTTGSSGHDSCNDTLTWSSGGFADTNYSYSCSCTDPNIGSAGETTVFNVFSRTSTQITTVTQTEHDGRTAHCTVISCLGVHD